jgi:hypothetical protein
MKKLALVLVVTLAVLLTATAVFAQPYTPNIANDNYGSAQGGGNLANIPTPNDNNDNLAGVPNPADINDAVNLLLGTNYTRNSDVDFLQWTLGDKSWKDLSSLDSEGTYVALSLTAGNTNTLQVYNTTTPGTKINVLPSLTGYGFIGNGSSTNPFLAGFSPLAGGTNFGWALQSDSYLWDSDPANNVDRYDHMMTYYLHALAGQTVWIKSGCGLDPIDINASPDYSSCTVTQYTFNDPYLIVWEDLPYGGGLLGDEDYDDMIFLVDRVSPNVPEPATMLLLGSGLLGFFGLRKKRG